MPECQSQNARGVLRLRSSKRLGCRPLADGSWIASAVQRRATGPVRRPTKLPCQSSYASRNLPYQVSTPEPAHLEPTSTTTASPHCLKCLSSLSLVPTRCQSPRVNLIQAWPISNPTLSVLLHSSCEAQSRRGLSHLLSPSSSARCCLPFFLLLTLYFFTPLCTRTSSTCPKPIARTPSSRLPFLHSMCLLSLHSLIAFDRHGL